MSTKEPPPSISRIFGHAADFEEWTPSDQEIVRYRMLCMGTPEMTLPNGSEIIAMASSELAAIRLKHLAEQVGNRWHERPKYGWKSAVARRIGIDPSYLNRVIKGRRTSVGAEVIDSVSQAVPISREYFTVTGLSEDSDPLDVDWLAYLKGDMAPAAQEPPREESLLRTIAARLTHHVRHAPGDADQRLRSLMRSFIVAALDEPPGPAALAALRADTVQSRAAACYRLAAEAQASGDVGTKLRVRVVLDAGFMPRMEERNGRVGMRRSALGEWERIEEDEVPNTPFYWRRIADGDLELLPWSDVLTSDTTLYKV